ncbi:hypothetical protein, partial [Pseudomonas sp.]|uniref:hypothetical protein n=1 Tax=Pseudomonas sp. TaxID=306 RepID=UPI003D0A8FC9
NLLLSYHHASLPQEGKREKETAMDSRTVISDDRQRSISGRRKRRPPRLIGGGEAVHHKSGGV